MKRYGVGALVLSIGLATTSVPIGTSVTLGARAQADLALRAFVEGEGPPLVMLGGGTFGAVAFAPHAQMLANEFRVVRLQTLNLERAQAQQALPAGYSVTVESAAMTRALDQLGISGAIDLVGWSFGGLVALDFALDHPERVHTLALYEPPAFWALPPEELRPASDLRRMVELCKELLPARAPTDEQYVRFLCALGNCGAKPPASGHPDREAWETRRSALRGLSAVSNHTDRTARLEAFRRPVLIMTGADTVALHRHLNDILAATLPIVERVELAGGHTAPVTARDEFVAKLRAFLTRHRG
jgi:pimeloyl-ACP methyl ester carboxylesterase